MRSLLRGRTLTFHRRPANGDDRQAYTYDGDGSVLIEDGRIIANGPFAALKTAHPEVEVIDHRPHLILPGFIDPHIHYPQMQVVGSYAGSLLEWLNRYTFIEEQRFADQAHAERIADLFMDELIRYGTTTAVAFARCIRAAPKPSLPLPPSATWRWPVAR